MSRTLRTSLCPGPAVQDGRTAAGRPRHGPPRRRWSESGRGGRPSDRLAVAPRGRLEDGGPPAERSRGGAAAEDPPPLRGFATG